MDGAGLAQLALRGLSLYSTDISEVKGLSCRVKTVFGNVITHICAVVVSLTFSLEYFRGKDWFGRFFVCVCSFSAAKQFYR